MSIPAPGIVAVAWEMIRQVQDEAAKMAMVRAGLEAETDRLKRYLDRMEEMERAGDAGG